MAIPLTIGGALTEEVITKDQWNLAFENVNFATMEKVFNSSQSVWVTFINPLLESAPVGLNIPKYSLTTDIEFKDGVTLRNIYIYPVGEDAKVRLSA
jgi:hypothetical protein